MRKQVTVTVNYCFVVTIWSWWFFLCKASTTALSSGSLCKVLMHCHYIGIYICYSPAWWSVSEETVPEVLSTVDQGHTFFQIIWTHLSKLVNNIDISFFLENECKMRMKWELLACTHCHPSFLIYVHLKTLYQDIELACCYVFNFSVFAYLPGV